MQATLTVTTSADLLQALERLSDSPFLALDTEFMRESTYFPKLCLIQAATADFCALIDPLAIPDLQPLWLLLARRECIKVLHSARQDYEVISLASPSGPPGPVFDSQVAAALLGYPAQIGYGPLVSERLGVSLAKDHTRADWSKRPLSEEQLRYAADDVRYLAPLYLDLRDALEAAGRLEWLLEETRELEHPELHRTDPQSAWQRLKGLDRLQPEQRATAKLLAQWRETTAMKHDKPRGWILADDALREIAERLPSSIQDLERIRTLPPGVIRRRGTELLSLVEQGCGNADAEAPATVPSRPEPQQLSRVTRLMSFVRGRAQELRISPELLATRRDIERLVFSGRAERLMKGWRREVIGEHLAALADT
jgi:ribonuclease D